MRYSIESRSGRRADPKAVDHKSRANGRPDREPHEKRISDSLGIVIRHYKQNNKGGNRDKQKDAADHDRKEIASLTRDDRPFRPSHTRTPGPLVLNDTAPYTPCLRLLYGGPSFVAPRHT